MNRVAWVVVILGGLTAVSSILASIFGAQAILLAVCSTIFTIAVAWMAGPQERRRRERVLERQRQAQLAHQLREEQERRQREQRARRMLDQDCADLLRRAEAAESSVLASDARAQNLLDPPIDGELLRENVQAVLSAGINVSKLRARQREITDESSPKSRQFDPKSRQFDLGDLFGGSSRRGGVPGRRPGPGGTPGPMTEAVLGPQREALAMVLRSVTSRVENLEHYASSVKAVDRTYRDWLGAQKAERLNDSVRDALAEAVRDELAVEELRRLIDRAAAAELAFRESIHEANLAGESLALPKKQNS